MIIIFLILSSAAFLVGFLLGLKRKPIKCVLKPRMPDEDIRASKKVLTAAALTYVAALATSLANLLRLVLRFGGRNRD